MIACLRAAGNISLEICAIHVIIKIVIITILVFFFLSKQKNRWEVTQNAAGL
jgi:hypothetical protein